MLALHCVRVACNSSATSLLNCDANTAVRYLVRSHDEAFDAEAGLRAGLERAGVGCVRELALLAVRAADAVSRNGLCLGGFTSSMPMLFLGMTKTTPTLTPFLQLAHTRACNTGKSQLKELRL